MVIQDIVQPPPRPVGNPAQPPSHSACNPGGHPRVTSLEGLYVASLAGVNSNNLLDARTCTELSEWLGHDPLLFIDYQKINFGQPPLLQRKYATSLPYI